MKRISFIIAALAAIVLTSCNKQTVEDITSYYKAYTSTDTEINLGEGATATFAFYAKTTDAGVDGPVTVTFKVDPSLVGTYNTEHGTNYQELPASCYTVQTEATIRAMYRMSSEAKATVTFGEALQPLTNYVLPIVLESVTGHSKAFLAEDNAPIFLVVKVGKFGGGAGTQESPYMIYDVQDLKDIATKTPVSEFSSRDAYLALPFTYFKLANDIDLGGEAWTPIDLGMEKTKGKKIDLDGAGKTIRNFTVTGGEQVGFIKGLVGDIHDLKIEGATVTTTAKKAGILVGQASTGDNIYTYIYRCSTKGTVRCETSSATELSLGGVVGQQCYGEINECASDVTIEVAGPTNAHYIGGIVGSFGKKGLIIKNCISKGNLIASEATAYMFGGILGCAQNEANQIVNCISLATITCSDMAGGIIAELNHNSDGGSDRTDIGDKTSQVNGCIAWNDAINAAGTKYGSGAIIALGGAGEFKDCYRKADLQFSDSPNTTAGAATTVASYNGKAAAADATASQVAKTAGWDETIWDLTGDIPALKCFK